MLNCSVVLFAALAIASLVASLNARQRNRELKQELDGLRTAIDALGRLVAELRGRSEPAARAPEPQPEPRLATPPAPVVVAPPPPPPPPVPVAAKVADVPPPPPPPSRAPRQPFDWESLVGVKLFSWIAGIALVLAAIFFFKYSVEHGWLRPAIRAAIGLITGTALIVICELRVSRGYKTTANALHGAGIAILYATLFATYALWHLAPAAVVFGAMLIVTAIAVALSIRRDSIFISLLGLLGGFATPALLSTGENRPIGLFSYLLLLNIALAWVAMVKRWPLLTAISIAFTVFYQWAWAAKFLTAGQLPLAAGIFVVFAVAAGAALWVRRESDGAQQTFDRVAVAAAALPLLFAVFTAAVPAYGARYNVLFTFLLLVTAGLAVVARKRGPGWLNLLGGLTTLLVFALWLSRSYSPAAWPATLVWTSLFVLVQLTASHFSDRPRLSVAPLLIAVLPALAAMEQATESPLLLFGTAFLLLAIIAAYAIVHDSAGLYLVGAFFVITAEAIWSGKYLKPDRLLQALAIYGIFGLFFLGVPLIGRRFRAGFGSGNAMSALLLASIALLFFIAVGPVAKIALWGLALLLAIVNAGAMLEARSSSHPLLSAAAILLSWIVIAVWCGSAMTAATLVPALAVIGGFAVLALVGNAMASRADESPGGFANATFLALAGHVFLLIVASQRQLAFPPWPIFAVLLVLDLAIGAAAIYVKRAQLMTGALALTQAVLLIWTTQAAAAPWPVTALIATLAAAAMGLVWYLMSPRFAASAVVALFLAGIVAILAGQTSSVPLDGVLLAAHALIILAILFVAWRTEWHELAVVAVPLTAVATQLARNRTPAETIAFASVLYAFFIVYPLLLGTRVKRSLYPYLAAVLASVPFFFFVRRAMIDLQLGNVIGGLPLFQALLMMALLLCLLRVEPRSERVLSRLALVAAAALAFITVAIPLQLEKQWITIAWALEAAALLWLFRRIPHQGLLAWSTALFAATFVRLVFNPAVFSYHPVSHTAIVNWYLYTYGICAAAFFVGAQLLPREDRQKVTMLSSGGTILLFFLLNIEIADYYSTGRALTFNFFSSSLAQDLTYTIGWAIFAIGMLVAGLLLLSRATRVAAILLLVATILKCFLHDLARLGGLYRVGSLLGLAVSLVIVGVLLQKFVMAHPVAPPQPQEPS